MVNFFVSLLHLLIFVSAIGSFVVLKPLFKTFTKAQKIWVIILVVAVIIVFFTNEMPDMIKGYSDGYNAYK